MSRAGLFEAERARLIALAYRMLGERAGAEDVVQEAWLRWQKADIDAIESPGAWLTRCAARLAIDALRAAKARREVYTGPWLPEPITAGSAEAGFELAQDCELALLWAMERLAPDERAAFILRRVFDAGYDELAALLGRSEAACRQLVSRAARRVREARPRFDVPAGERADMLARFTAACAAQDHAKVLELLAPGVVAITDGGRSVRAARRPLEGAEEVAQVFLALAVKRAAMAPPLLVEANAAPALEFSAGGAPETLLTIGLDADGRIDWIYVMRNPQKLGRDPSAAPGMPV